MQINNQVQTQMLQQIQPASPNKVDAQQATQKDELQLNSDSFEKIQNEALNDRDEKAGELASQQALMSGNFPKDHLKNIQMNDGQLSEKQNVASETSSSQIQFADPMKQIQFKDQLKSSGIMTDILGAGPMKASQQPWASSWVFGGELPQIDRKGESEKLSPELLNAIKNMTTNPENKLSLKGSDEKILDQKLSETLNGIHQLVESLEVAETGETGEKEELKLVLLSGDDFLNLLKKDKNDSSPLVPSGSQQSNALNGLQKNIQDFKDESSFQSKDESRNLGDLSSRFENMDSKKNEKLSEFNELQSSMLGSKSSGASLEIVSNVVPGSMMKSRMSSEAVNDLSDKITSFSPQGSGEMKIRLNPGNLGELMIHVSTHNGNVGLKVQASRGEAKKILEESVASLKEALLSQNLNLNKIEFSVQQNTSSQQTPNSTLGDSTKDQTQQQSMNDAREERNNLRAFTNSENSRVRNSFTASVPLAGRSNVRSNQSLDVTA